MKKTFLVLLIFTFSAGIFAQSKQTMTVKVYFGNEKYNPNMENCGQVYAVNREIPRAKAVAKLALEELFKGVTPEETAKNYISFSAKETAAILKSIKIKNNSAYVNFNRNIYEQLGNATTSCGGNFFFSSVEKTLTQFTTIKKVFYAIEWSPKDFYEWAQVGECPKELKNCSGKDFE